MSFSVRLSGSSGNPCLAWSMGNGGKGFIVIKFPLDLARGWYGEQPCTKFRTFQHRKERKGLKHEFIVLKLLDGSVCRVERMGDPDARFNALSPQGSTAQDIARCFGPEELDQARLESSSLIAEIELPCDFDLMDVLKVCRAIQEGEKTRNYTLQVYNCYFFALAIQVCLTRLIAHWEDKELFGVWLSQVNKGVDALTTTDQTPMAPNSLPHCPIIFRLYSVFDSCDDRTTWALMSDTKSKLQHRIKAWSATAPQDMSYRINDLLWHSTIDSSLSTLIEEKVKKVLVDVFQERFFGEISSNSGSIESPKRLQNTLLPIIMKLLTLPDTKHPAEPLPPEPDTNAPKIIKLRSVSQPKTHDFSGGKANNLNYTPRIPKKQTATITDLLVARLHQMQRGVCWILLGNLLLWVLHHAVLNLCGVAIFTFERDPTPCTIVEQRLGSIIAELEQLPDITYPDWERFIAEVRELAANQAAVWDERPWDSICRFIAQHIPSDLLERLEVQTPRLTVHFGAEPEMTSVSAFQRHALNLIQKQANEVESFWLGSAATIQVELRTTLSQVWKTIRDDRSILPQITSSQGMTPLARPSPDALFRNVCDLTSTTKIIGTKPFAYGGYSDIWRGFEWGAGATRDVAIKIIRVATRQTVSLERLKKRISREIVTWSAVGHRNILPFYGLSWVDGPDGLPAMVYPYCEAGTCSEYLKENADADRMGIVRQVADGLNHLHSFNPPIAHGDIKAANILMKQDGTPLIADFGLSRLVMELSTGLTTSSSRGSYRWMAPELFGGIDNHVLVLVTTASDVWAFGCLCLEILLGVLPWASTRSDAAIMLAVVKDRCPPPLPPDIVATSMGHIMRHCWVYEPSKRPNMIQLVTALAENDPEHLHASACALLPPPVFSDSPPAILNSDSDSFTRTFSESPLISSDSRTVTRTKTPVAPVPLEPLFPPREAPPSHQRVTPVSSSGATPYLDMLSFTPSDSSSSGPASRDEPSLFEIPATPLFGPGPRRPSRSIRETRQNTQPFWPRTPSSSSSTLPQSSRGGGDDIFRPDMWRRGDASTPSSTRPPTRPPSQSSLHIWTPPRTDSRHSLHAPSMSPLSQYSSDRSTNSLTTPVTPVGQSSQYPRHYHSHSTTCMPSLASPGHYYATLPPQSRPTWSPTGAVPRDFQFAMSRPIRISTPDGVPVKLPERKPSSSPIKADRSPR